MEIADIQKAVQIEVNFFLSELKSKIEMNMVIAGSGLSLLPAIVFFSTQCIINAKKTSR